MSPTRPLQHGVAYASFGPAMNSMMTRTKKTKKPFGGVLGVRAF
jgi:hypothetical protein